MSSPWMDFHRQSIQALTNIKETKAASMFMERDAMPAILESNVAGYPRRQGKVRDLYDLGDRLVLVASDRISAFDWVLPTPIPDKGRVLTQLTLFWLDLL